jgi:hypothetical protein
MAFFKDKVGFFLFIIVYIAMISQVIGVFLSYDDNHESMLIYHKAYFLVMLVLAVWSHIKASITDPGMINHMMNLQVLQFYLEVHEIPMRRAEKVNQAYGRMLFEKMDENDEEFKEDEDDSDWDETEYEPVTTIDDEFMAKLNKEYKVELKRCNKCYIVRVPRVHHCSVCKGCIMKMDHHCPWINNCVGQFNQKFFIQFCGYCLTGCIESTFITLYYLVYRHKS